MVDVSLCLTLRPSEMEVDEDNKSKEEKDENAAKEETRKPQKTYFVSRTLLI